MNVYKIGGSCLKNGQQLKKLLAIIKAEEKPLVIVVSALNGITSYLENALGKILNKKGEIACIIGQIRKTHLLFLKNNLSSELLFSIAQRQIELYLKKLENNLKAVHYSEEISPALRARILACGERLSAIIFSTILNDNEIPAESFQSDEIGIISDSNYDNASILIAETSKNLLKLENRWQKEKIVAVITGFFAVSREKKITLLGRNSSDYSAAVLAKIFNSDKLVIWKDSSGVQSADPKIVPEAFTINELNFEAASELAYFGAKVLHPRTIEPILNTNTKVEIRSIEQTDQATLILKQAAFNSLIIAHNTAIGILRIIGPGVGFRPGIISRISTLLNQEAVNILSIITSQTAINLLLNHCDLKKCTALLSREQIDPAIQEILPVENKALLAVISSRLIRRRGIAALILNAVSQTDVNIELLAAGASDASFYFIIDSSDLEKAIKAIHREILRHKEPFPYHISVASGSLTGTTARAT